MNAILAGEDIGLLLRNLGKCDRKSNSDRPCFRRWCQADEREAATNGLAVVPDHNQQRTITSTTSTVVPQSIGNETNLQTGGRPPAGVVLFSDVDYTTDTADRRLLFRILHDAAAGYIRYARPTALIAATPLGVHNLRPR
jgi:hypothetical protein